MQYSAKLKMAASEIDAILKKHDIAGMVFLHTPGHGEFVVKLDPKYSAASVNKVTGNIDIKTKREHYNGDAAARDLKVANTSNMLKILTEMAGPVILHTIKVSEMLDNLVDAKHSGSGGSSHTEQNN
jgi:hypothetical protein